MKMRTLASIFDRLPLESETLPGVFADSVRGYADQARVACAAVSYRKRKFGTNTSMPFSHQKDTRSETTPTPQQPTSINLFP